jgi:zona occludens toxin (predicted ATPase)
MENETAPADAAPEATGAEAAGAEAASAEAAGTEAAPAAAVTEDISYHAVEKDGVVTAIWEMQGRKHIRTIDPRSRQGQDILRLYTTEHHDETPAASSEAASS